MKHVFALPVPPLALGTSWTGKSLLNWIVAHADDGMKAALLGLRETMGGDQFRGIFEEKARELNARLASRVLDARGLPAESALEELTVSTGNTEVN